MKLIAIGDLHGKSCWQNIVPGAYDRIVFVGDYCDDHRMSPPAIIENLENVIVLKLKHHEKVVLLLGNHDIQYSEHTHYACSGYNEEWQPAYTKLFTDNKDLFQVAFQVGDYLFTHAGVSTQYLSHYFPDEYEGIVKKAMTPADLFNEVHRSSRQPLLHTIGRRRGGYDFAGGITWADVSELTETVPGYHQVVGHNRVRDIHRVGSEHTSITFIDVLHTREKFFELDTGVPQQNKL